MLNPTPIDMAGRFLTFFMSEAKNHSFNARMGHAGRATRLVYVATGVPVSIDGDSQSGHIRFYYKPGHSPEEMDAAAKLLDEQVIDPVAQAKQDQEESERAFRRRENPDDDRPLHRR